MFKLISATPSPFARKVRIALIEKDLPFALVTEVPWDSSTRTPDFNPLEKLPILILEDGASVYDSSHILDFLELKYPQPPLLPADADGILTAKRLDVLCNGVCDALVLFFFERMRAEDKRSAEWAARQQRKIEGGLREIARLVGKRHYAVGEMFTLGDIAAATAVGYVSVRYPEMPWRSLYPDLAAYADRLDARPSFVATRPVAQSMKDKVV
jgi:glutathione S-transferase